MTNVGHKGRPIWSFLLLFKSIYGPVSFLLAWVSHSHPGLAGSHLVWASSWIECFPHPRSSMVFTATTRAGWKACRGDLAVGCMAPFQLSSSSGGLFIWFLLYYLKTISFTDSLPSKEWATLEIWGFSDMSILNMVHFSLSELKILLGQVMFVSRTRLSYFQIFISCIFVCFYYILSDSCNVNQFFLNCILISKPLGT